MFAARRTWQRWETEPANGAKMPLAAWALFTPVAPERDATHFQPVIMHARPTQTLRIKINDFVVLQPRRGPRLLVQLLADDGAAHDLLTPGQPRGCARGVVVGFPDLTEADLVGCPYWRGDPVRFALDNILTTMESLPHAHRYAVSVEDPAVQEVFAATAARWRAMSVPSTARIERVGPGATATLTASTIVRAAADRSTATP